jgi:hypothetical protein
MPITGTTITLRTNLTNPDTGLPEDAIGAITLKLIEPFLDEEGKVIEHLLEGEAIEHDGEAGSGKYHADYLPTVTGLWHFEWLVAGQAIDQGDFEMESKRPDGAAPDLTDLWVLVPRTRRACEGPFGPPRDKRPLTDMQIYELTADACAEVILFTGKLFSHELLVKQRDPLGGFPTRWRTDSKLSEWETAFIANQAALNYYYHLFRELRTSEKIQNEGTSWEYTISANVIKGYLETLMANRDLALKAMMEIHPVIDRFASIIRVRDQATVTVLEWWDQQSAGASGSGLPGGQEATSIPWFPGAEGSF